MTLRRVLAARRGSWCCGGSSGGGARGAVVAERREVVGTARGRADRVVGTPPLGR
ncbi:hypothetical protein [Micromonospora mangrovi]|uniref:Uncharacterized protein n=1 Tax=Micromonospora sp. CCTCC AA 2012012 TaxID=3111921 RepID=A0AAU7M3Q9_9ACTN